ncbi:MAG: hypothetical protein SOZ23_00420 [Methanosphaera sp.]|uniref:hypothetical protein n=1 Tax=Methanosphaera sp. TaxID=2666342 RepID=UPI0025F65D8D|nr:hypothetical protein [Methanosphaera sp.]MCI5866850.1 hypothetical protein [Methanosphaera sp.]MDY3955238.1 hypothetical protein [Methanosphaera sp.]
MVEELQCRLCGCRFDPKTVKSCECGCPFGGCHGENIRCPNCGHEVPCKKAMKNNNKKSFMQKIKESLKA